MKKLCLVCIALVMFTLQAEAGLISLKTLSEDASIGDLNDNFNTVEDEFNGSIEAANIAADTLTEAKFADDINPRIRTSELLGDITDSGHLPATSTNLTSDISAGTSYVSGYRCVTAATSKTYTASKDTWVYIDINSNFQYEEVANSAAQPATPSNSLLLAKVVTDSDNITSVTDLRTTNLSVVSPEDFTIKGYYVLSSDTQAVSIDPGVTYVGSTRVVKTAITALRTSTASDWHDGVADSAANAWWYIGAKSTGDVKWLGANPPNYHDSAASVTDGTLYYWNDGSNSWRIIGVVRMNSGGWIDHIVQAGNRYYRAPLSLTTTSSEEVWKGLDCSAAFPKIARIGIFHIKANDSDSDEAVTAIRPFGMGMGTNTSVASWGTTPIGLYAGTDDLVTGEVQCPTRVSSDTSQVIQYYTDDGDNPEIAGAGFITDIRD